MPPATKRNGPPRRPAELTRKLGNPGKRPLASVDEVAVLPAARETPKPWRPLGKSGRALWNRTWKIGSIWLSPDSDIEMLLLVCELLDERDALRARVLAGGDDVWRERSALRALDKQIMDGLAMLGFTPTDRARLGVAEVRREDDLEAFRRRAAQ